MQAFAPIFPGWNVWDVWQAKDLSDLNPIWIGVSHERRLRIWVEDAVRLGSGATNVDDPIDLKGSQVQFLPVKPSDLETAIRKEQVDGPTMLLGGPAKLFTVRFFNKGAPAKILWPHDDEYLLDRVYQPSAQHPATTGEPPPRISDSSGISTIVDTVKASSSTLITLGALALGILIVSKLPRK